MSNPIKQLCAYITAEPNVLTFTDIARAASEGAAAWPGRPRDAWAGALLGISLEASKRVVKITEGFILTLEAEKTGKTTKPSL